jgi:hypothetical protein
MVIALIAPRSGFRCACYMPWQPFDQLRSSPTPATRGDGKRNTDQSVRSGICTALPCALELEFGDRRAVDLKITMRSRARKRGSAHGKRTLRLGWRGRYRTSAPSVTARPMIRPCSPHVTLGIRVDGAPCTVIFRKARLGAEVRWTSPQGRPRLPSADRLVSDCFPEH